MSAPVRTDPAASTATSLRVLDSTTDTLACAATWPADRYSHTEIVDILRHFGFQVLDHANTDAGHRFTLDYPGAPTSEALDRVCAAFAAAACGITEIDAFSGLILRDSIGWHEIDLIRAAVRDEIAERVEGLVCAQLSGSAVADRNRLVALLEQLRTEDRLDLARASVVSAELLLLRA